MDKTVVIFESKYGFTERYAQWISEALACPVFRRKDCSANDLSNYETVIYGGGLYAGGVSGIKLLTQNWQLLSSKNVILFTCGLADPADPENTLHIQEALAKTFTSEMLEKIRLFHLRGGIDYSRLSFVHSSMMAMMRRMLLKKEPGSLRQEDQQLLDTYGKRVDFTDRESIQPLIQLALKL